MAVSFTHLSYWIWGGKEHEAPAQGLNSSSDFPSGFREHDSLRFSKARSPPRRVGRKWQSREERRIDKEYDIVIVPSDGVCMSGSESDDSDWSIGWLEPHAPDFASDSESESSFAVLVPCYGRGRCDQREIPKSHVLGSVAAEFHNAFTTELLAMKQLHQIIEVGVTIQYGAPRAITIRSRLDAVQKDKSYIEHWLSSLHNM